MHDYLASTPEERAYEKRQLFWFVILVVSFVATVVALTIGLWKSAEPVTITAVTLGTMVMTWSWVRAGGSKRIGYIAFFGILAIGSMIYLWQHAGGLH